MGMSLTPNALTGKNTASTPCIWHCRDPSSVDTRGTRSFVPHSPQGLEFNALSQTLAGRFSEMKKNLLMCLPSAAHHEPLLEAWGSEGVVATIQDDCGLGPCGRPRSAMFSLWPRCRRWAILASRGTRAGTRQSSRVQVHNPCTWSEWPH